MRVMVSGAPGRRASGDGADGTIAIFRSGVASGSRGWAGSGVDGSSRPGNGPSSPRTHPIGAAAFSRCISSSTRRGGAQARCTDGGRLPVGQLAAVRTGQVQPKRDCLTYSISYGFMTSIVSCFLPIVGCPTRPVTVVQEGGAAPAWGRAHWRVYCTTLLRIRDEVRQWNS